MGKTVKLTIRLSPEDMAVLRSHTARTRLSQSAYLRKLIRGYVPKAYPPVVFFDIMGRLNEGDGRITSDVIKQLQEAVTAPEKIEDG